MSEIHRNGRGSRHDAREPSKKEGIMTRCWRATKIKRGFGRDVGELSKRKGDPDTMLENIRNEKEDSDMMLESR